ncbi:MAG: RtcB family protein [Proteobacteria bacterium]|nr:RtcB family protein [Pseudomonadota bacterium]MBU1739246.1 RtcB family protein [Pseudomonadota bacterium]
MKQIICSEKIPIKLWLDNIEPGAMEQARNLANLPFSFGHIAIMPDAHQGYGMPIGGVLATLGVVVPNGVGVDIGCGVCAVRTSREHLDHQSLKQILAGIRENIPVGFKHHSSPQDKKLMPETLGEMPIVEAEFQNGLKQLGTLGGGNHFIEIQQGDDGFIWLMIHSGSRNIGYRVAAHYNKLAENLCRGQKGAVPKQWQLASLPLLSNDGRNYLREMNYCVNFALANRNLMMERTKEIVQEIAGPVEFGSTINVAHNYAAEETHYGRNLVIHRKGATRAFAGEPGIIPGSQGSKSYLVRGKGNEESFRSCAHGAGRRLGRKQAQRELDLDLEIGRLDRMGVIHSIRKRQDLDEAAGAYKDIETVLNDQQDLVEIATELTPLAVVKG